MYSVSTLDSYNSYVKKLLVDNIGFKAKSKGIYKYAEVYKEDGSLYISYKLYKKIVSLFNIKAGIKLIHGYHIHVPPLGYLYIGIHKRSVVKPRLNRGESFKLRKQLEAEGTLTKENWLVYYTDDDYIKLTWFKQAAIRNIIYYKFLPAGGQPNKGFRQIMSREISSNPNLKALYPFIDKKEKYLKEVS
jgi:hypothetical protein